MAVEAKGNTGTGTIFAGERRRSHQEIRARAERAAQGLRDLGIAEGDAVALLLRNDFAFFEASLAASLAGAYTVPVNWHATAEEAGYILRDCAAKVLVAHDDLLGRIRSHLPQNMSTLGVETPAEIRAVYGLPSDGAASDGAWRWDDWLRRHAPIAEAARAARAAVIYTSGTTGRPKGVRRAPAPPEARPTRALTVYGFDRPGSITALINGPMYHSVPNAYGRLALQAGADIVLQPRFDAEELLAMIARHRVTHLHMVPAMFVRLLRLPPAVRDRYDLSSLRHVAHGAAPCPQHVKRAMIDWWGPVLHEYYGSTETGLLTMADAQDALRKPGTVGRALPGITLAVIDEAGRTVAPGMIGEIYAGSATLHDFTYVGLDALRAQIGRGDLVTAGDIGWLDQDGYLFLCDRKHDVVVSGGLTIYPAEIEMALLTFSGVNDCAVFGVPDAECGEAVCACVEPIAGGTLDPAQLRVALAALLAPAKLPRQIVVVSQLPREDSGKIFKRRLRDPYWVAISGQV